MATYVGYHVAGIPGAILTTLSLVLPSFLIFFIVSGLMERYSNSSVVQNVFSGLRPAAVGLIAAAGLSVFLIALFPGYEGKTLFDIGSLAGLFSWKAAVLFAVAMTATQIPKVKDLHPLSFILVGAVVGIAFRL